MQQKKKTATKKIATWARVTKVQSGRSGRVIARKKTSGMWDGVSGYVS